jgi:arylsulfatase A-like enzyme
MTDQHRADSLRSRGHPIVRTPNLDRLAGEGINMERAYCTTPLCVPSRTTVFTGQHAARHAKTCGTGFVNRITLDETQVHLPGILQENGYTLALVGKNHAFTDDYLRSWGFCEMYDLRGKEEKAFCSPLTPGDRTVREWRSDTSVVPVQEGVVHEPQPGDASDDPNVSQTEHALRFLHTRARSVPFFMYLSYESPHFPNVVPEPFFSMYDVDSMPGPIGAEPLFADKPLRLFLQYYGQRFETLTPDDHRRIQASYLAQISLVDSQIGRVCTALRESGEWENTLVVFVSDHGDFWGNHGLVGKTNACYEDLLHVPMIWKLPDSTGVGWNDDLCDLSDVLPTVLDVLGLERPATVQGSSLLPVIRGGPRRRRPFHVAESHLMPGPGLTRRGYMRAIEERDRLRDSEGHGWFGKRQSCWVRSIRDTDGMKLITNENDTIELYDLNIDPREHTNLYADDEERTRLGATIDRLLASLERWSYE